MFQTFNAMFDAPKTYDFAPAWWGGYAYGRDPAKIAESVYAETPLRVASDGWTGTLPAVPRKSIVCLDFEGVASKSHIIEQLDIFRAAAPNLRVGYYPFLPVSKTPFPSNRDRFIAAINGQDREHLKKWMAAKEYSRDLVKRIDFLSPDCYLLGNECFDRDIAYIVAMAKYLRSYDKPVYAWIWGVWHEAWNPPITLMDGMKWYTRPTTEQFERLRDVLKTHYDGAIVWGDHADNIELCDVMKEVT